MCNFFFHFLKELQKKFQSFLRKAELFAGITNAAASSKFQYPPFDIPVQISLYAKIKRESPM